MLMLDRVLLGAALRAHREAANLTLRQVAERAGCTYQYVSDIELGSANVTIDRLQAHADAIGADLHVVVSPAARPADPGLVGRLIGAAGRVSRDLLEGVVLGLEARADR